MKSVTDREVMLEKWKYEFFDRYAYEECFSDSDFRDLAMGFFLALGATPEEADKFYEECVKREWI